MRRRSQRWRLCSLFLLLGAVACREPGRVDTSTLEHTAAGPRLRVTVLGTPADPRVVSVREAIAHWNSEFIRLGRHVQLDSATIRDEAVPDEILRGASREVMRGGGPATARLRERLTGVPGDIIILLSNTDLVSFGLFWRARSPGVVVIRRSDVPPLSLPNAARNVVAHELGHVLGLRHNLDPTTLMCGRPAPCRPTVFASDTAHFFPFTAADEQLLRKRWP